MAKLEDLMQYGSRRKVEGIAAEMGYPKGSVEYPTEVLEEVKKQATKKRSVSARAQEAAEDETANTAEQDLRIIEIAAENRAAGMLVALDALTMHKCATRKFSDPKLQQVVEESQTQLRQFLGGVATVYDPENFLSQSPLAQIAAGESGSMRSLPSSSSSPKNGEKETKPENGRKSSDSR